MTTQTTVATEWEVVMPCQDCGNPATFELVGLYFCPKHEPMATVTDGDDLELDDYHQTVDDMQGRY